MDLGFLIVFGRPSKWYTFQPQSDCIVQLLPAVELNFKKQ